MRICSKLRSRAECPTPVLDTIAFALAFTLITFLHIVLGELALKTLALERTERIALVVARPLHIFYRFFRWPIRTCSIGQARAPSDCLDCILQASTLRLTVKKKSARSSTPRAKANISEPISIKLINRVFDFRETEVREAMIPRTAVSALSLSATLEETKNVFRATGYSRLPVYRERLDEVVGIAYS